MTPRRSGRATGPRKTKPNMPGAAKKDQPSQTTPADDMDDDFEDEFGSPEEVAALMIEAFTMPQASDYFEADKGEPKAGDSPEEKGN